MLAKLKPPRWLAADSDTANLQPAMIRLQPEISNSYFAKTENDGIR